MRAYVPLYLAVNYLLFAFVASLGALQAAGLASGDRRLTLVSPHRPRLGRAVAVLLIAGAYAAYWLLAPELLTPGPAGAELTALFALAALAAWGVVRLLNSRLPARPVTCSHLPVAPSHLPPFTFHLPPSTVYLPLSLLIGLFDAPLFRLLNGLAGHSAVFDTLVQFSMNDYIVPTAFVLTLLGLWFSGPTQPERALRQSTVLRALLTMLLASIVLKFINELYFRPRPFTYASVTLLFYHPSDSSFPSNAATVGFSLAVSVWARHKKWGTWMLLLAGALGLARVCGGVHYPLDIVAGAWLGGLSAWAVSRMAWLEGPVGRVICLARRSSLA